MEKFTHGSLFSGIGGFDLAAEWMGWENKFHCEWNEFGQKVLHHYWPNAECFTDITKSDFTKYANKIDILTGGFPCQPYSSAGKRKGKEDERHLWPEMLRAIREISPRFVVGENVRGLTNWNGGLVFDEVCAELESLGYQVAPIIIPACAINAPHRRERIWFVATNTQGNGWKERREGLNKWKKYQFQNGNPVRGELTTISEIPITTNTNDTEQRNNNRTNPGKTEKIWGENKGDVSREFPSTGDVADTERKGFQISTESGEIRSQKKIMEIQRNKSSNEFTTSVDQWNSTNTNNTRFQTLKTQKPLLAEENRTEALGRDSVGSIHSRKGWENFPTESPVCGGNDGISTKLDGVTFSKWRNESIKAYGNAIVPQVAYQIFQAIEKSLT